MALKNGVFLFLFTVLAWILSAHARTETVWLKDLTTEFEREKRNLGDLDLPDELTFHLRRMSGDLTLNLKRNHGIDPNADIYMARTSRNGRPILVKTRDMEKSDVAHYQDVENCAFMTVRCVKRSNDQCDRVINGNVQIGERNYDLQPEATDVTLRNVLDKPGRLGKRYILKDQAHMQRDTSIVNEKITEQDFMGLFRRFERQNKQNNVSPSDVKLSKSATVVNTRAAKDKIRAPTAYYTVKVAVLIDTGVWDLYSAMIHSSNPLTRSRKVKEKIRESFSHIMNGADMRYKRIRDDSISITVILSRFVYFKRRSDLKFYNSVVTVVNGTEYIDGTQFILDVLIWDQDVGKKFSPKFDTAMIFTRYRMYDKILSETLDGYSFPKEVCNIGTRISIVRASDYLFSSLGAAHELGHSLGASHDGELDATACSAADYYIMTDKEPAIHPSYPYPSNLWTFSRCSVEAFKRVLSTKDCVKEPGKFFDAQEYAKHIKQEPGEVYSLDHQCHVTNGPGAVYCGVLPLNMCYLMCTDPRTGRCRGRYYMAARGTQCGHNMWCIEAKCVRKGNK